MTYNPRTVHPESDYVYFTNEFFPSLPRPFVMKTWDSPDFGFYYSNRPAYWYVYGQYPYYARHLEEIQAWLDAELAGRGLTPETWYRYISTDLREPYVPLENGLEQIKGYHANFKNYVTQVREVIERLLPVWGVTLAQWLRSCFWFRHIEPAVEYTTWKTPAGDLGAGGGFYDRDLDELRPNINTKWGPGGNRWTWAGPYGQPVTDSVDPRGNPTDDDGGRGIINLQQETGNPNWPTVPIWAPGSVSRTTGTMVGWDWATLREDAWMAYKSAPWSVYVADSFDYERRNTVASWPGDAPPYWGGGLTKLAYDDGRWAIQSAGWIYIKTQGGGSPTYMVRLWSCLPLLHAWIARPRSIAVDAPWTLAQTYGPRSPLLDIEFSQPFSPYVVARNAYTGAIDTAEAVYRQEWLQLRAIGVTWDGMTVEQASADLIAKIQAGDGLIIGQYAATTPIDLSAVYAMETTEEAVVIVGIPESGLSATENPLPLAPRTAPATYNIIYDYATTGVWLTMPHAPDLGYAMGYWAGVQPIGGLVRMWAWPTPSHAFVGAFPA